MDLFKNTRKREAFLRGQKMKSVHDEHLIRREIYNPNNFDIEFKRNVTMDTYIKNATIPLGPLRITCKADDFLYLPHAYYFAEGIGVPQGTPIDVVVNFGDNIGIGNKKASLLDGEFE